MKRLLILSVVMLLSTGSVAYSACTAEDLSAKAQEFATAVTELAQNNPDKYQELALAMQEQLPELQQKQDMEALCGFYDEWIAKAKN